MRTALVLAVLAATTVQPAHAQSTDFDAETGALVFDLLAPYSQAAQPPTGVDAAAYRQALEIIKREKLLSADRPRVSSTGQLGPLGQAIGVGSQAGKAPAEMAALRDAALRGDADATGRAITAVYARLGWKAPEGQDLAKFSQAAIAALGGAGGGAPPAQNFERKGQDYTVTVSNDRAGGKADIDVDMRNGPDGKPAHVTFSGKTQTKPNTAGTDLENTAVPDKVKTYNSEDIAKLPATLNGVWIDQDGDTWDVAVTGAAIALTHQRGGGVRKYVGTVNFKDVQASFPITRAEDLGDGLPGSVRQQLAGMGLDFRVRLKFDDSANILRGVWISRNVTYDRDTQAVERVHDPFDSALVLKRKEKKTAQGGRFPQDGP